MTKILGRCVLVVLLLFGTSMVTLAATAAPMDTKTPDDFQALSKGDCWRGKLCFWTGDNFTGSLYMYPRYPADECHNFSPLDNDAESMWNRSGASVDVFQGANCRGASRHILNNSEAEFSVSWDNTLSSFRY